MLNLSRQIRPTSILASLLIGSIITASCGGGSTGTNPSDSSSPTAIENGIPVAAVFKSCGAGDNYSVNKAKGYAVYNHGTYFLPEDLNTFECSQSPSFARDANNLYWKGEQIPFTNFSTLKLIGKHYANDGNTVFGVKGADPATFEIINPQRSHNFTRDKSHVFYISYILDDADRDSFVVLNDYMGHDNEQIIARNTQRYRYVNGNVEDLIGLQPLGGVYFKDANNVVYYLVTNGGIGFFPIAAADGASFEYIGDDYAKDSNSYYYYHAFAAVSDGTLSVKGGQFATLGANLYRGSRIEQGADVNSLVVYADDSFAYDANRIYGKNSGINSGKTIIVDTTNFRLLEGGFIMTDSVVTGTTVNFQEAPSQLTYLGFGYMSGPSGIYRSNGLVPNLNAASFEILGILYNNGSPYVIAKDSTTVLNHFSNAPDAATYEFIHRNFARDINRVYYGTSLITGADRNTFQVLNNSWSKDSTSVYYRTSRIGGMNAATFVAINEEYGHDATQYVRTYNTFGTYSVNALEILGAGYARVGSRIYYERNLISAADASSFQVVSDYPHSIATDSNNLYIGNTIITGTSIDMNSFKYYNSRFFGDNQNIFTPYFKASDTASFKMIGSQYYRDANNVYYYPSTLRTATHLATADPDQFTYMGGSYYKDNNEVFFDGNVLSGLDGSTTVVPLTRFKIAKDADTLYYQSALVNINAASFEVIPYGQLPSSIFYRDATGVYCQSSRLTMANRASFVLTSENSANDVGYTYYYCTATLK